ncbi:MAG: acetyl-CoA carboxylase biotin carboxyl carrier protein [Ignavibacteria bacterium]|nr:acetyl-CoA carboxylase biotin carboxyl carrier protein [Ignavibacteria bacterium]
MKTDLNYIKKLIKLIESGNISEIEIEEEGTRLKVVKSKNPEVNLQNNPPFVPVQSFTIPQVQSVPESQPVTEQISSPEREKSHPSSKELIEVRSPIVGTFYRAPSPNADPYVQVGQVVTKGTVLCIIEAMKLMNEIESEHDGKIVKILVENGQPVEYNQVIFLIEPS